MRYFLDRDEDSHWYIVNFDRKAEWEAWQCSDPYSPDFDGTPPDGVAWAVGGWPGSVIFDNPTWENGVSCLD